ncbi:MAG: phage replisome organizer N-terminal domain-containing protein [Eubacteriales bacterium]
MKIADVKWIKITTDIFDDEKILLIESLPDANAIIVVWFKLLCLAGKQNNSGVFIMSNKIAYTDKMLATIFRMKESTVQLALRTFEEFGMIEIVDGVITIPNWGKHQNLDQLETKRAYMRNYMAEYREKQKALTCKTNSKSNSKSNVSEAEEDIERESDIDIERERDIKADSSETACCTKNVQRVIEAWNSLGLTKITKISDGTVRSKLLKKRIKDYGIDSVLEAIENVRQSDFLMGKTSGAFCITFDWFIKPNNFPKVLDGNYRNKKQKEGVNGGGTNQGNSTGVYGVYL